MTESVLMLNADSYSYYEIVRTVRIAAAVATMRA